MSKYTVGKTYKAFWGGDIRTFEVLEEDNGTYGIRWDDDWEEWAYESDMYRWTEAVREREEECS